MTSCFSLYIVWGTVCVNLLSAEPEISVSGPVGSTAVLPCNLTSVDPDELFITWNTVSESVFQRRGEKPFQAEGYEGRADVPVEELRKGNCSLVLHNLRLTDTGVYTSYQAVKPEMNSPAKLIPLSHVKLSVYAISKDGKSSSESPGPTGDAAMKNPHSLIMILSFLSCLLFLYII